MSVRRAVRAGLVSQSLITCCYLQDRQERSDFNAILSLVTPLSASATGLDVLHAKHKSRNLSVPNFRFPNDRRLWDVESLLQTTQSRPVKPEDKPHLS